ncbi:MAG: sigma-70 family RNA polymerase sigma factor [Bdellovibrionaceae bacterium]|nr:sigma-70 family RNA polymerase sigma factor [Pseudobdellovibrionaceae bacterium]
MMTTNKMKQLIDQYEGRLLRFLLRLVTLEIARDIVQEVFLRRWQAEDVENEGPWLFRVARNLALDHYKREDTKMLKNNNPEAVDETLDEQDSAEESLSKQEQKKNLWSLVQKLPVAQKEVMLLKFQEEFSYKEISAVTGHSVSYVGVLIHEGMMNLRTQMVVSSSIGGSHE